MVKFGFVVLHFNNASDTIKCVESVLESVKEECWIVIVDNGSNNDSYEFLRCRYEKNNQIVLLRNIQNLGFSKGMNCGLKYLKTLPGIEFICLVNNDTTIETNDFSQIVSEDFLQERFAVLGPRIINDKEGSEGKNPYWVDMLSPKEKLKELERGEKYRREKYKYARLNLLFLYSIITSIRSRMHDILKPERVRKRGEREANFLKDQEHIVLGCPLNGAFLILSQEYWNRFDGLEEVTFAYGEEWLLYNRCSENKLIMMYDPRIIIKHSMEGSTRYIVRKQAKRYIYKSELEKKRYESLKKYIENKYDVT